MAGGCAGLAPVRIEVSPVRQAKAAPQPRATSRTFEARSASGGRSSQSRLQSSVQPAAWRRQAMPAGESGSGCLADPARATAGVAADFASSSSRAGVEGGRGWATGRQLNSCPARYFPHLDAPPSSPNIQSPGAQAARAISGGGAGSSSGKVETGVSAPGPDIPIPLSLALATAGARVPPSGKAPLHARHRRHGLQRGNLKALLERFSCFTGATMVLVTPAPVRARMGAGVSPAELV